MSFRHVRASQLVIPPEHDIATSAQVAGWEYMLDGVPVSQHLHAYATKLREAVPNLKFGAVWGKYSFDGGTETMYREGPEGGQVHVTYATEVWVCMDVSHYALAKIGHKKYRQSNNSPYEYGVAARGIENKIYGDYREQYCIRMSVKQRAAVKNALLNLIPYTVAECATLQYDAIKRKSDRSGAAKTGVLPSLLGAVSHNVLMNEVRALRAAGVAFTTPEFQAIAEEMDDAVQLANAERNKRVDAVMVQFVTRGGVMRAECSEVRDIRRNDGAAFAEEDNEGNGVVKSYAMEEVPPFIVEKVSVLQGLDNGGHVDSVGMKVNDTLFWVEK
jgi:hypothetical protein